MTRNLEKLVAELSKLPDGAQMGLANTLLVQLARSRVETDTIKEDACHFISLVLLVDWDPIGIFGVRRAEDEYDSYVEGVFELLSAGAADKHIAAHLLALQSQHMGVGAHCSNLRQVTQKLRRLWNTLTESKAASILNDL
ncbi:MAG: hypothetical protein M3Y28_05445 [Armatimonadota bacterium]|nr:hypothetical protein [Armatimonadota bacterium]